MRIGEYKQIGTTIVESKQVPVMGLVYRDASPEEERQAEAECVEIERLELMREPTAEECIEAQVMYTALMTNTLLMED